MRKIVKKRGKKQKNTLEFRFALFRFEEKITKVKRSEKFEAKISEKREVKFYSETHVKRIQSRFISLIREKIFMRNGRTLGGTRWP
jgi:hypothetical protein